MKHHIKMSIVSSTLFLSLYYYSYDVYFMFFIFSNVKYAKAPIIIGDPSYFPSSMTTRVGRVVRSICILNHPIAGTV